MDKHFETLARSGYVARGVVYMLLGGLAVISAVYGGDDAQGSSDALSRLLGLPFGRILLGLVAIGLFGHILWRLAQGLLNADGVKDDAAGLVGRIGSLVSAGANVFLALTAAKLALSMATGESGGGEEDASAWLLTQPFGPYLLGIAALCVIAAGLVQVWKGVAQKYRKHVAIPPAQQSWLEPLCQFGLISRGILLAIVGGFVCYAALTVSAENAGGVAEALDYVHALPFGRWLYGLAALGLVAFGIYSAVQGFYRRVDAPSLDDIRQAVPGVS